MIKSGRAGICKAVNPISLLHSTGVMANSVTRMSSAKAALVPLGSSGRARINKILARLAARINFHLSIAAMVCTAPVPMSAKATLATAGLPASA